MKPRKQLRPRIRGTDISRTLDTRDSCVSAHFASEKLLDFCIQHGIDPNGTMLTEYIITGNEKTSDIYGILASYEVVIMRSSDYIKLRHSTIDDEAKVTMKKKVKLIE
jgi:hypothetical protein